MKKLKLAAGVLVLGTSLVAQETRDHRTNAGWSIIANNAKDVAVNEKGVIYMTSNTGSLAEFTRPGWNYDYEHKLSTYAAYGAISIKVLTNGNMLKKDDNASSIKRGWRAMPGSDARDICLTFFGDNLPTIMAVMVNTAGKIYVITSNNEVRWVQLPGSDGLSISAGNKEIWLVNTAGKVYKYSRSDVYTKPADHWDQMPGSNARDISIAQDGTRWLTTRDGKLYRWYGSGWTEQKDITGVSRVAANNGKVAVVTNNGTVLYRSY